MIYRMKTPILSLALLAVVLATQPAVQAQDKPPADVAAWLDREAGRLLLADPAELSEPLKAMRETVRERGSKGLLPALIRHQFASQRKAVEKALGDKRIPPVFPVVMPEGSNGWQHFQAASTLAVSVEEKLGRSIFEDPESATKDKAKVAAFLEATAELPLLFAKAAACKHVTRPDLGVRDTSNVDMIGTATMRVAVARIRAWFATGDRDKALAEATAVFGLWQRVNFGLGLIDELIAIVCHDIAIHFLLHGQPWTADEIERLLPLASRPLAPLDLLLLGESATLLETLKAGEKQIGEDAVAVWTMVLEVTLPHQGWPGLKEYFDKAVELLGEQITWRLEAAQWFRDNPADIRDPVACKRVLEKLAGPDESNWAPNLRDMLAGEAGILAARVRQQSLRGMKAAALLKFAQERAKATGFLEAWAADDTIEFWLAADHPLAVAAKMESPMFTLKVE